MCPKPEEVVNLNKSRVKKSTYEKSSVHTHFSLNQYKKIIRISEEEEMSPAKVIQFMVAHYLDCTKK